MTTQRRRQDPSASSTVVLKFLDKGSIFGLNLPVAKFALEGLDGLDTHSPAGLGQKRPGKPPTLLS